MKNIFTPEELENILGENIKLLRLQQNIDRQSLCERAGVSENALRNLEGGKGSTLKTLIKIIRSLNRENWLEQLTPKTSINPLHLIRDKPPRQRARRKKHAEKNES